MGWRSGAKIRARQKTCPRPNPRAYPRLTACRHGHGNDIAVGSGWQAAAERGGSGATSLPLFEGRPGAVCTCPCRFHQISAPGGLGPHTCPLPRRGRPAVRACVPLPRKGGAPRPVRIPSDGRKAIGGSGPASPSGRGRNFRRANEEARLAACGTGRASVSANRPGGAAAPGGF